MGNQQVGKWLVVWGTLDTYVQDYGEDGPYTRRVPYFLMTATSERGEVYVYSGQRATDDETASVLAAVLLPHFNPEVEQDWSFARNIYGSEAYQANWHEEEYSRMDAEERAHYRR